MPRRILLAAAGLPLLAACRDAPSPTAPEVEGPTLEVPALASTAALHAVWDILDDAFVHEVVDGSGLDQRKFERTAADMTAVHVREDLDRLSESVHSAGSGDTDGDADREVLRAVLELILEDATGVAETLFENESSPVLDADERERR